MTPAQIADVIEESLKYEKRGEYEKAYEFLQIFWKDISKAPKVKDLTEIQSAEIYLRCGSIGGCLANTKQVPNLKTLSINLLTTARQKFIDSKFIEKIAECENYIAFNYWRLGAINEAKDWLEESFSHDMSENHPTRLHSHIINAFLLIDTKQPQQVITEYLKLAKLFADCDDDFLKGCYFNELGVAYEKVENTIRAIPCLQMAKRHFEKAKHNIYVGAIENNIAQLFSLENEIRKALKSAKKARRIFNRLGDKTKESMSIDTTAQILLKHKYYQRALIFANRAIYLLEGGEAYHNLVTSYQTKIKICANLGRIPEMLETSAKAHNIATIQIGGEFAQEILVETASILPEAIEQKEPDTIKLYLEAEVEEEKEFVENLPIELNFPTPQPFKEYIGINLVNDKLEFVGLHKDHIAIVGETKDVKKGDIVAVREINTAQVHCGVYDLDFGIIGLDAPNHEPLLFDEGIVIILGKVIGFCNPNGIVNNKMNVKLI